MNPDQAARLFDQGVQLFRRGRLEQAQALLEGLRRQLPDHIGAIHLLGLIAARRGVTGLRVSTRKPDVYPDVARVGVELSSF